MSLPYKMCALILHYGTLGYDAVPEMLNYGYSPHMIVSSSLPTGPSAAPHKEHITTFNLVIALYSNSIRIIHFLYNT